MLTIALALPGLPAAAGPEDEPDRPPPLIRRQADPPETPEQPTLPPVAQADTPPAPTATTPPRVPDEQTLAPGVTYRRVMARGPVVIHVIHAELGLPSVQTRVATGPGPLLQPLSLPDIVAGSAGDRPVVAAVNGGYSVLSDDAFRGLPIGMLMVDGELLADPWPVPRSALVLPENGLPRIERLALRGSASAGRGVTYPIGGLNRARSANELVLYTRRFNPATTVLEPGQQLVLDGVFGEDGRLRPDTDYTGTVIAAIAGRAEVIIPQSGVVLAGSGDAGDWLAARRPGETLRFRFELTPDLGPLQAVIGAGPRLLRRGEVAVEAAAEGLGVLERLRAQPWTAVGIAGSDLYLVAVDGRAPSYSVGFTLQELATFLKGLGCTDALALGGGAATTLMAGNSLANRPSGGLPAALSSALLITSNAVTRAPDVVTGTGTAPPPDRPDEPFEEPGRQPELPPATRPGELPDLPPPVTPRRTDEEPELPDLPGLPDLPPPVERPGQADNPPPTVPPEQPPTAPTGDTAVAPGKVVPEGERKVLDGFESPLHWRFLRYPEMVEGNLSIVEQPRYQGASSAKLRYDFTTTNATRAVYALYTDNDGQPVNIGSPKAVSVWIYGDGNGNWLRGRFIDANGNRFILTFADKVDWDHEWRRVTVALPEDMVGPIIWDAIYLVQHRPEVQNAGAIFLDQFEGIY